MICSPILQQTPWALNQAKVQVVHGLLGCDSRVWRGFTQKRPAKKTYREVWSRGRLWKWVLVVSWVRAGAPPLNFALPAIWRDGLYKGSFRGTLNKRQMLESASIETQQKATTSRNPPWLSSWVQSSGSANGSPASIHLTQSTLELTLGAPGFVDSAVSGCNEFGGGDAASTSSLRHTLFSTEAREEKESCSELQLMTGTGHYLQREPEMEHRQEQPTLANPYGRTNMGISHERSMLPLLLVLLASSAWATNSNSNRDSHCISRR